MSAVRWVLGCLGVLVGAYGAWLALTRQDLVQLAEVALWLAAAVAVHDVLVAGTVVGATLVGRRALPRPWHAPATLGLVVWGSVSVMAVPVLGRFGARTDNPTLLDRPYLATWLALTLLTLAAIGVAGLVRSRRTEA
ncbi:hypothetical protein GCM10009641_60510 [Mycobacterium cookii]|uniref:DUF3995 domain-containing protein n=1 Tax=Nocardioides furvisabuli TaxID=375542 RepID=A0ABP5IVH4_9ACTN|nr:hypothetical protein [Nocardioides furvisabuli]